MSMLLSEGKTELKLRFGCSCERGGMRTETGAWGGAFSSLGAPVPAGVWDGPGIPCGDVVATAKTCQESTALPIGHGSGHGFEI